MPADKKKSGSGEGSKLKPPAPAKLHATAKEFVPSGVSNFVLHCTANPFQRMYFLLT